VTLQQAIGQAILTARLERGVSQRVLVVKMGREVKMRTYLSKVETGNAVPRIESIQAIAIALGMTASDIVKKAEGLMAYPLPKKVYHEMTRLVDIRSIPRDCTVGDPRAIERRRALARKLGTIPMEVVK
jgi:transcriptional regulator with XRE-family HTH domain